MNLRYGVVRDVFPVDEAHIWRPGTAVAGLVALGAVRECRARACPWPTN